MSWIVGYMGMRLCVQLYSLYVYKPKTFDLNETLNKQPDVKEHHKKEYEYVIKEEPKEEEPETKAETI